MAVTVVSRVTQFFFLDTRNTIQFCSKLLRFSSSGEQILRQYHLTRWNSAQKDDKSASSKQAVKNNEQTSVKDRRLVSEEMKMATRDVAKSMGGNWTKTAEELMARLVSHQEPPPDVSSQSIATETGDAKSDSLLKTMRVGQGFTGSKRKGRRQPRWDEDGTFPSSSSVRVTSLKPRGGENFKDLFGAPRLGIFDAESVKAAVLKNQEHLPLATDKGNLWQDVEQERLYQLMGSVPKNAFEEMAQWTRQGKMWKFPVDNEEDMHEEKQVKFHEHIFLDRHLGEFPDQGPIRKFMELVVIGLGSNPWLTVEEKKGHIEWYANYFREKESILVASVGEQGKMKAKTTETN